MLISNTDLKKIYHGAYFFKEREDGYLQAFQYGEEQMKYFAGAFEMWAERCDASTAKTIELKTSATKISFDYKIIWKSSEDTFELWADGLANQIFYIEDLEETGTITFNIEGSGLRRITIYLPVDATVLIKNFEIDADYEPVSRGTKVLWLGDSITQGYGPLRSAHTYVSNANRVLGYDIINQGIGGYIYDKKSLLPMEGYKPEKIIVALGTNQYGTESMTDIEEYYETLINLYGDTPVLCITPLWRGDNMEGVPTLIKFCERVKEIASRYPNVKIVDGFKMVPHLPEYFLDNLHPNTLGTEVYASNLIKEIEKLGF